MSRNRGSFHKRQNFIQGQKENIPLIFEKPFGKKPPAHLDEYPPNPAEQSGSLKPQIFSVPHPPSRMMENPSKPQGANGCCRSASFVRGWAACRGRNGWEAGPRRSTAAPFGRSNAARALDRPPASWIPASIPPGNGRRISPRYALIGQEKRPLPSGRSSRGSDIALAEHIDQGLHPEQPFPHLRDPAGGLCADDAAFVADQIVLEVLAALCRTMYHIACRACRRRSSRENR